MSQRARLQDRKEWLYGCIVALHALGYLGARSYFFGHVNLFCDDAGVYAQLAELMMIHPARPGGWPLLIRLISWFSQSGQLLVAVNAACTLAANLLLFDLLAKYLAPRWALATSLLPFVGPHVFAMSFMAYMPDSIALFGTVALLWLGQAVVERSAWARATSACAAALLVSYLAIVKSVFLHFGALTVVFLLGQIAVARERIGRALALAVAVVLLAVAVPGAYATYFFAPEMGKVAIEGFGGWSVLGNILRFLPDCEALARMATREARVLVREECHSSEELRWQPQAQIFAPQSLMNRLAARLEQEGQPTMNSMVFVDGVYRQWLRRGVTRYPMAFVKATGANLAAAVASPLQVDILSGRPVFGMGPGCESLVRRELGLDPAQFTAKLDAHRSTRGGSHGVLRIVGASVLSLLAVLGFAVAVVVPVLVFRMAFKREQDIAALLPLAATYAMSQAYLLLIALGSVYDSRYYPPWHVLSAVTAAMCWRLWRERRVASVESV